MNQSGNWPMNKTYAYSLKDDTADPGVASSWTDHGAIVDEQRDYKWSAGSNHLWAPDVFKGPDGLFYAYVPDVPPGGSDNSRIGVMVASSPTGPYAPPSGFTTSTNFLPEISDRNYMSDPSTFADPKDPNQQRYMLYADGDFNSSSHGCGHLSIAKLDQTTSKLTSNQKVVINGAPNNGSCTPAYIEGGEIGYFGDAGFDGNGKYFLYFAMKESNNTESIAYATADTVTGPYTYQGMIMNGAGGSGWTNQAAIVEWQGHYLFFYHNDPRGGANPQRQVFLECVGISNGKISSVSRGSYKTLNDCPKASTGMSGTGGNSGTGGSGSGTGGAASSSGGSSAGGTSASSGGRSNGSGGGAVAGSSNGGSTSSSGGSSTSNGGSSTSSGGAANGNGGSTTSNGGAVSASGGSNNGSGGAATANGGSTNGSGGAATANGGSSTAGTSGGSSDSSSEGCSCRIEDASKAPVSTRGLGVAALGMLAFVWRRRNSKNAKKSG